MIASVRYPLALSATFIWIGFVCAISFMEAWLKFRAPGITVPLGLGIGRIVFSALNKVEWLLMIIIAINVAASGISSFTEMKITFIPLFILIIQTFWLLPALDHRAELHITGQSVPSSNLHIYFIIAEVIKVSCLTIFGVRLLIH